MSPNNPPESSPDLPVAGNDPVKADPEWLITKNHSTAGSNEIRISPSLAVDKPESKSTSEETDKKPPQPEAGERPMSSIEDKEPKDDPSPLSNALSGVREELNQPVALMSPQDMKKIYGIQKGLESRIEQLSELGISVPDDVIQANEKWTHRGQLEGSDRNVKLATAGQAIAYIERLQLADRKLDEIIESHREKPKSHLLNNGGTKPAVKREDPAQDQPSSGISAEPENEDPNEGASPLARQRERTNRRNEKEEKMWKEIRQLNSDVLSLQRRITDEKLCELVDSCVTARKVEIMSAVKQSLPSSISENRVNELIDQKIAGTATDGTTLKEDLKKLKDEFTVARDQLTALAAALKAQTPLTENQVKDAASQAAAKVLNDNKELVRQDDIKNMIKTEDLKDVVNQKGLKKHVGWRVWLAYGIGTVACIIAVIALFAGLMFPRPSGSVSATSTKPAAQSRFSDIQMEPLGIKE